MLQGSHFILMLMVLQDSRFILMLMVLQGSRFILMLMVLQGSRFILMLMVLQDSRLMASWNLDSSLSLSKRAAMRRPTARLRLAPRSCQWTASQQR